MEMGKLEYLRSLNFTWGEVAALLGTSSKSLQRRAKDWNIPRYSTISDGQLDGAVNDILRHFPSSGEVMIRGHLQSQKVKYMINIICGSSASIINTVYKESG